MGKTKSAKGSKPKSDPVKSVKSGGVTKPSQTPKSKSKDIARTAAKVVADKKLKELRGGASSSEDDSDSGSDSDSDSSASDSEMDSVKPAAKGKKINVTAQNQDSDSSSDSESDEDDVPAVNGKINGKVNGKVKAKANGKVNGAKAPAADDDDTSDSSDSSDSEMADGKVADASDNDSEEDSDSSDADSDSGSSGSDSESEKKNKTAEEAPKKRKMEDNDAVPAKKAKMDDGNDVTESSNLFVGHLSWNIDDEWLASEFRDFEGFIKARVVTHRDNPSHSRGFGYVDFNSLPAARAAMEAMQGKEIDGKTINVDLSTPRSQGSGPQNRSEQRAKTFGDVLSPESNTLFVGNLPFEITRDEVWEFFSQTVEPKNVRLPTDPDSGKPKGFGYVEFHSVEDAKSAMEGNQGTEIGEDRGRRPLRLDYAQSRPPPANGGQWRGGDRGGRGGRGGFGDRGGRGGGRGGRGGFGDRGGRGGFGDRGGRGGRGGFSGRGRGGGRIDTNARSSENKITFDN